MLRPNEMLMIRELMPISKEKAWMDGGNVTTDFASERATV